jgi:endonuclease/exonuclease/phosphatase family metal-dependent hydrolase
MKLCLVSSNIRFDNPSDGPNAWHHRRVLLAQTLLKHSPDIIATQEGRFDQLNEFCHSLENYVMVDPHRSWIRDRMYPTFFLRKNIFELIHSEDLWLSETPEVAGSASFGSTFPRLFTWIKVQVKDSLQELMVVNTHLDHVKPETRVQQVKVLSREMKKILTPKTHLVVMGDFNDHPESQTRQVLVSDFPDLQDSWKIFNQVEETSHHSFTGVCENGSRIDWIMVDGKLIVEECRLDKTHQMGRYPSDHFPVICKIRF